MDTIKVVETEMIDRLFLELSQFTKARTLGELQLEQLLYAVGRKFPGESRFETALRYITEAESHGCQEGGIAKSFDGDGHKGAAGF